MTGSLDTFFAHIGGNIHLTEGGQERLGKVKSVPLSPEGHIVAERIAVLAGGWLIAEVRWDGGPKGRRRTEILLPMRDVALVESEMPTDGHQAGPDGSASAFWTEILTRVDQFWLNEPPASR